MKIVVESYLVAVQECIDQGGRWLGWRSVSSSSVVSMGMGWHGYAGIGCHWGSSLRPQCL